MANQVYQIAGLTDHLAAAIDAARAATTDKRWRNAIDAGASWLLEQESVEYSDVAHALTIASASGRTYVANGACQCEAFAQHNACYHRAAARLVRRALELRERAPAEQLHEVEALADELQATEGGTWYNARQRAAGMLGELATVARQWDAAAIGARLARARAAVDVLYA